VQVQLLVHATSRGPLATIKVVSQVDSHLYKNFVILAGCGGPRAV
jgi:hypothetical protein